MRELTFEERLAVIGGVATTQPPKAPPPPPDCDTKNETTVCSCPDGYTMTTTSNGSSAEMECVPEK